MGRRLPTVFDERSEPVARRVAVGLHKLGLAMKHQAWSRASEDGLSPTQGQILATLALEGALTGSELAERLGVSLPTVSDSVRALVEKGAVDKRPDPRHARATLVTLTALGTRLSSKVASWPDFLTAAVDELAPAEQEAVLSAVVKMIRSLQERGLVPMNRMCVSCTYFRPHAHQGATPHHCALVDAPMADRHLRVDCAEHEAAEPAQREATWRRFSMG